MGQAELGEAIGIGKSSISEWESGKRSPDIDKVKDIAKVLNVTPTYLMGWKEEDVPDQRPLPAGLLPIEKRRIPILGPIAAGTPLTAEREYDNYISIAGDSHHADAALRIEGDSMTPRYLDGDLVLIRLQDDVDNGQIAAVCIDDCITLKRLLGHASIKTTMDIYTHLSDAQLSTVTQRLDVVFGHAPSAATNQVFRV